MADGKASEGREPVWLVRAVLLLVLLGMAGYAGREAWHALHP